MARHRAEDEDGEEEDVDEYGDDTMMLQPDDSIGEDSETMVLREPSLRELSLKPKMEALQLEPKTGYFCGLF